MKIYRFILFFISLQSSTIWPNISCIASPTENQKTIITIHIPIDKGDSIYSDLLSFSISDPHIDLSEWHSNHQPIMQYDNHFKKDKPVFNNTVSITLHATGTLEREKNPQLNMTYYSKKKKRFQQRTFSLVQAENLTLPTTSLEQTVAVKESIVSEKQKTIKKRSHRFKQFFVKFYTTLINILLYALESIPILIILTLVLLWFAIRLSYKKNCTIFNKIISILCFSFVFFTAMLMYRSHDLKHSLSSTLMH